MSKTFLTAEWKNLLFINYEVDTSVLLPYLPKGTELDIWNNCCYVSLVGFMFLNTKIKGIAFPFYKNFEEFNLRFYVRFRENGEWKRGVVFIKEVVPRRMICFIADLLYEEHYYYHQMKNSIIENGDTLEVKYEWRFNNEWNFISAVAEKNTSPIIPDTDEEFITEHYWGYTKLAENKTSEYNVAHPKWNIHKVLSFAVKCDVAGLYGKAFQPYLEQAPKSVFMAEGSRVSVNGRKIWKY